MKRQIQIIVGIIILSLCGYVIFARKRHTSSKEPASLEPTPEDLELVRSLPYTQWSEENVDLNLVGVTKYEPEASFYGYNLYTNDDNEVYLMDMKGNRIHTWYLPAKKQCECAKLLENGDLIVVCVEQSIVKLNPESHVLWENKTRVHHDVAILPKGDLLVLDRDRERYNNYKIEFDSVLHLSQSGEILGRWSTFENLQKLKKFHPGSPLDTPRSPGRRRDKEMFFDYYHLNAIEALPQTELGKNDKRFQAGNLLICSRHLDWIAILDKETYDVVWSWGPNILDGPHMPTMLQNGNLLIFDNGTRRRWSRVIELEPLTGRIVWKYQGNPPESFFSAWRGSNQRLQNGNTIITDSDNGHVFEVDSKGNTVWEFWNPDIRRGKRKRIYRLTRLEEQRISRLLKSIKP